MPQREGPWFKTIDHMIESFSMMPIPTLFQPSNGKSRPVGVILSYPIVRGDVIEAYESSEEDAIEAPMYCACRFRHALALESPTMLLA
jgi:hypothetical protein